MKIHLPELPKDSLCIIVADSETHVTLLTNAGVVEDHPDYGKYLLDELADSKRGFDGGGLP